MAKWLNKYFSLGNNKTTGPPQPDYRNKRNRAGGISRYDGLHHHYHHISPGFLCCHLCDDTSDLLRAYHAQKDRDFEDPYSRPGSSLRRLHAVCHPDYCVPEDLAEVPPKASFSSSSCCAGTPTLSATVPTDSPHLFCSHSKHWLATPPGIKYISPEHRLIKIESDCSHAPDSAASMIIWSPPGGIAKKLNKGFEQLKISVPSAKKEKVSIVDDYSNPFDARSGLNKVGKGENTAYMEPYEAQRIMNAFQRQGSVKSQQKSMQLYDTPYEPEDNGIESDSESVVSQHLQESKLPQDDDRPADEYDQPWEWNRVTIPALAVQFNGIEKQQVSLPSNDQHWQLRASGGGFRPIKNSSLELCGSLGDTVDPTIPLEKQTWYHGAISRTEAENLLRLCKECSYLVRNSQTNTHDYSLSLKSSQGFMHMKLVKSKEKYILGQNSPPFDSIPEVIHHYTTKKLPIKGAEHLSLFYPVAVQTL
ncbi:SH2 domain-containing adapter protein B-like [Pelecanus crispus]|uniref:SH2 domain-containing adapter protein B-like n=1 Tax=Pelecanus crispus TaxID=36300 RepID=UPI003F5D29A2